MGKRGPRPTPTAILEKRGSWRAKERTGEPVPEALAEAPKPPRGLKGVAAAVWKEAAPSMAGLGTLTGEDLRAFERYCRLFALWQKKAKALEDADEISENAAKALGHLDSQLRRLEAAFGKSPADRASLKVPERPAEGAADPFRKPGIHAA